MGLVGFFLGAGASCGLGMPLVWDLTGELKALFPPGRLRTLNAEAKAEGRGFDDQEIATLENLFATPSLHYEAIVGHLEVLFQRAQFARSAPDYFAPGRWLLDVVYGLLYERHVQNALYIDATLHTLARIEEYSKRNAPLWIFSLNHDLIIECIAAKYGVPINCGISGSTTTFPRRNARGVKIGDLRAEMMPVSQLENGMPFWQPGQSGINLLKIHGSLDVFAFQDLKYLVRVLPETNTTSGIIDSLCSVNSELVYPTGFPTVNARTYNEITFADDAGIMQFLRRTHVSGAFKFDPRFSQVQPIAYLAQFKTHLNFVTNLICIGYGFGDIHINQALRSWLELSADRQLQIVGPGSSKNGVPAFLLHLSSQISLTDATATDFLS